MDAPMKLAGRRSLAQDLFGMLRARVERGELAVGSKLPTEKEFVEELGVSRTVVREAIARLAAEGMVEPRQGLGVFVVPRPPKPFQILDGELDNLRDVGRLLDLRLAVETEMAGAAAERRTAEDLRALRRHLADFDASVAAGGDGMEADEALHAAIATAADNQYFVRFLKFLGTKLVPRRNLVPQDPPEDRDVMFGRIRQEHLRLVHAIEAQDEEEARRAVRDHLDRARSDLRQLIVDRESLHEKSHFETHAASRVQPAK